MDNQDIAPIGRRLGASAIDALLDLLMLAASLAAYIAFARWRWGSTINEPQDGTEQWSNLFMVLAQLLLPCLLVHWWNRVSRVSRTGASIGMRLLGIHVVDDSTGRPPQLESAAMRELGRLAGLLLFGAGALSLWFDPQRRAWHDRLTGTRMETGSCPPARG